MKVSSEPENSNADGLTVHGSMIEHNITGMTLCLTVQHVEELDELSQLSFKANTDQATAFVSLHYVLGENNNSQCYETRIFVIIKSVNNKNCINNIVCFRSK